MYYLQSRYYDPAVGRFINADGCFAWDVDKNNFTVNAYLYCNNDPVNQVDDTGNIILKIVLRAIVGALFGAAMQYLADVLQNLLDFVLDKKRVTRNVWKVRSGTGDYVSAIITGACDATLQIGVWKSLGVSTASTILAHIINFAKGKGFNYQQFIKDLVWNALLTLVSNAITKKFKPKQGKQFNEHIRKRYKVKGTNAYKHHWESLCECVEWNSYMITTFVNTLRSASRRILDFVEAIIMDCLITALAKAFGG